RLGHERRQREKYEVTFWTLPAPAVGGTLATDAEIAVAAREHVVVTRILREGMRDGQFRPRPQQREVIEIGGDMRLCILTQPAFEIDGLAPLVIDRLTVVFERRFRRGALVRECDRVVAIQQ